MVAASNSSSDDGSEIRGDNDDKKPNTENTGEAGCCLGFPEILQAINGEPAAQVQAAGKAGATGVFTFATLAETANLLSSPIDDNSSHNLIGYDTSRRSSTAFEITFGAPADPEEHRSGRDRGRMFLHHGDINVRRRISYYGTLIS